MECWRDEDINRFKYLLEYTIGKWLGNLLKTKISLESKRVKDQSTQAEDKTENEIIDMCRAEIRDLKIQIRVLKREISKLNYEHDNKINSEENVKSYVF